MRMWEAYTLPGHAIHTTAIRMLRRCGGDAEALIEEQRATHSFPAETAFMLGLWMHGFTAQAAAVASVCARC